VHWLGFLFLASPRTASVFRERLDASLRQQARSLAVIQPASPAELETTIVELLKPSGPDQGCVWLEGLGSVRTAEQGSEWSAAWGRLLLRLNEVRDRLSRTLPESGVLLVARPGIKNLARTAAPDLWSARSLVLEPRPVATAHRSTGPSPQRAQRSPPPATQRPEPSAQEIREPAAEHLSGERDPAAVLEALRRGEGLLVLDRPAEALSEALSAAHLAAEIAEAGLRAEALWLAARAAMADGDPVLAAEYLDEILPGLDTSGDRRHLQWLDLRGKIAQAAAQASGALGTYESALRLARRLLREYGDSPERLRDLSVSLERVGDVRRELGDTAGAGQAYEEALELSRRLLREYGDSPERLRDLSVSLERVGNVRREGGENDRAALAYREALEVLQRARASYGSSPDRERVIAYLEARLEALRPAVTPA
jgi:tetratricopeptide (TPR) repeat protein